MTDPTARADRIAANMRAYYEQHRETWWQRFRRRGDTADNFMLGLLFFVKDEIKREADEIRAERNKGQTNDPP
jgi:hypothetical protein